MLLLVEKAEGPLSKALCSFHQQEAGNAPRSPVLVLHGGVISRGGGGMDKKNPGQKTGGVVNVRPTIKDRKPPGTTNTEERYRRVIPVMLTVLVTLAIAWLERRVNRGMRRAAT